jgi:prepilin-type processing-associated H-X9-DG protein
MTALSPYMKNQQVLACPSAGNSFTELYGGLRVNYGLNEVLTSPVLPLARVQAAADVALLADCTIHRFFGAETGRRRVAYADSPVPVLQPPASVSGEGYERHSGGSNIAYCDGHIKWQPATFILSGLRMQ